MFELKNVFVHYPDTSHDALMHINITLNKGDFVCILGKSGAGKSTLIRCMNGLQRPTKGEIVIDHEPVTTYSEKQWREERREIGMIFQHFNLIPRLSVMQNVLTGIFGYRSNFKNVIGWFRDDEIKRAKQVLADVGLEEFANRRVENLSGGQKQRVGIARAFVQRPRILLGDEPVASLDPGTSNHIFSLLKEMHQRLGLLTVINVHDIDLAKRYATRIIALRDGKMIFDGSPEQFTSEKFQETYGSPSAST